MSIKENIQLRDVRDRLSELLKLGEPYPLQDLPVPAVGLTVPFKHAAKIPVELSQLGVLYQLHDPRERLVVRPSDGGEIPVQADGTGEAIRLETPPIEDDVTYKILATKVGSNQRAYLHEPAVVKVGLDTSLSAQILIHPSLDPAIDSLSPTDPRLCDYADTLQVEITLSQEGVDYKLVHFVSSGSLQPKEVELSTLDVRGTDGNIVLHSKPILEDTMIRIRATKTFEPSEGRETQSELLVIELPLKVKANRDLGITVSAAIVDHAAQAAVHIASTQTSAQYRVFAHRILDPEIVHEPAPDTEVLRVRLPDEPEVQVRRPLLPEPWSPMANYEPTGEFHAGNGGELIISIDTVTADYVLIIEAMKSHQISETNSLTSSVWLLQPMLVLVRPNPTPGLELSVVMAGAVTDGRLQVEAGQPGVFYFFRTTASGKEFPLPAYFHQRDDEANFINKGLDQLEVGIDLVVAADPPAKVIESSPDLARRVPQPPLLECGPLATGTSLYVRAMKAQTRIEAKLAKTGKITALPDIHLAQVGVDAGSVATIQVSTSQAGDVYELMLDGEAVKPALPGDGSDLEFETAAVTADSMFEVRVTRPADVGIALQRVVRLTVLIKPNAALAVSAVATEILIESSQLDVFYQLLVGGSETGEALPGNGGSLSLPTGPLTADTTFVVRAVRRVDATVAVELTQQVSVTIRPA